LANFHTQKCYLQKHFQVFDVIPKFFIFVQHLWMCLLSKCCQVPCIFIHCIKFPYLFVHCSTFLDALPKKFETKFKYSSITTRSLILFHLHTIWLLFNLTTSNNPTIWNGLMN
jgi:hypothetical protein